MSSTKQNISVLINNFNYAEYLGDCIRSALVSEYEAYEVIVVDDGSTDNSQDVISSFGSSIKKILKENGGQASAFNAGFEESQGDIIVLLDSDDVMRSDKIEFVAEFFSHNPTADWMFHEVGAMGGKDRWSPHQARSTSLLDLRTNISRGKAGVHFPPTSGLAFRRKLLERILPMPEEQAISLSDNYLKYSAAFLGQGAVLEAPLAEQRIHGSNAYTAMAEGQRQIVAMRIAANTAYHLSRRWPGMKRFALLSFARSIRLKQLPKRDRQTRDAQRRYVESISAVESATALIYVFALALRRTLRAALRRS